LKTTAFHLQKGGVGKTSMSAAIAYELSKRGRTIVVDIDPQGNASSWLAKGTPKHELADVLFGKVKAGEAVMPTAAPDLDILPTFGLEGTLKVYGENQLANEPYIFEDLTEELSRLGYEFAVFDLSPGFGRLERAALIAASEVITPAAPDYFSLDGLEIFDSELAKLTKAMRKGPNHLRVICNAYDGRIEQHKDIYQQMSFIKQYEVYRVPVDPAFRKAQALHVPLQALADHQAAKKETLETIAKIGVLI